MPVGASAAASGPRRSAGPSRPGCCAGRCGVREFWLLTAAFATSWLYLTMLVTLFIPLFTGLGASPAMAVAAASTVGPFQVCGRIVLMLIGTRVPALPSTRFAFAMMVTAGLLLLAAGAEVRLIFGFAILQGASVGIMSILRPVLTAEVMGAEGFGAISGAMSIAPLLGTALAPILGAALYTAGGPRR